MAEHADQLTGPDLSRGIPVSSVSPGELVAGHAFGESVLLIHVEPNWFAVGGKCTHYGATLAEGLLVSETIRCPWHHACFDLRNGAASRAPALNDLPSYSVVVENDIVRVTGKRDPTRAHSEDRPRGNRAPTKILLDKSPVVGPLSVFIIGASAAGIACAEMLRREGYRGPITLADVDPDAPYDRPNLSKDYLAGNAPEEWLSLHPPEFFQDQQIGILSGVEAHEIDIASKTVRLSDGSLHDYGALLIATGASPVRLAIQGGERIRYLRTLADCRDIIGSLTEARTAVVIGSSFIGLEVAASLATRGVEVHIVAPEKLPLERVLGADLGHLVQSVHEERGVKFHLGHSASAIEDEHVVLDDGSRLDADIVVAGLGVRPNLQLAEKAGILLDNGIAVNEFLETSARDVFAGGDVARWPDAYSDARLRVEHWVVAQRHGQVVARNMLGHRDRFDDIPFFWSAHYDKLSIQYTGHVEHWDETRIDGDVMKLDCAISYIVNGKRRAIATINRDRQNLQAEVEMERELVLQPPTAVALKPSPA